METKYIFIIDTNEYAGNFERDMCAFCTGMIGDCEVGKEESEKFIKEESQDIYDDLNEIIEKRPDDHGCCRPTSIYLDKKGNKYNSVAIYFFEKPSEKIIEMIKARAKKFTKGKERIMKRPRTMKILGFRMKKETLTEEDIKI